MCCALSGRHCCRIQLVLRLFKQLEEWCSNLHDVFYSKVAAVSFRHRRTPAVVAGDSNSRIREQTFEPLEGTLVPPRCGRSRSS